MKSKNLPTYQSIRDYDALIRLATLTFLGIVIQSFVFFSSFGQQFILYLTNRSFSITNDNFLTYFIIYFSIVFVYSLVASASFNPKRIVSPLYIQIGVITIISLIMLSLAVGSGTYDQGNFIQKIILITIVFFLAFAIIGWVLTTIIRKIIALNGEKDDLIIETSVYNVPYKSLKSILLDDDFLKEYDLKTKNNNKDKLVLRSFPISDVKTTLVLMPWKDHSSILSITTYEIRYDTITQTKRAKRRINSIRRYIGDDAIAEKLVPTFSSISATEDNEAEDLAVELVLKSTKSPLRNIQYRLTITIIGLVSIMSWILYQSSQGIIDINQLIGALVSIIVAIILLTTPAIREKIREKS